MKGLKLTSDRPNHTVLIQWTTLQEDPRPVVEEFVAIVQAHNDVEAVWPTVAKRWASITVVIREEVFAKPNDENDDGESVRPVTTGRWASIPVGPKKETAVEQKNERWETIKETVKEIARKQFKDK